MKEYDRQINIFKELKSNKAGKEFVKMLDFLSKQKNEKLYKGWERWLQYELLYLLSNSDVDIRNPDLEKTYDYDGNYKLPKGKDSKKQARVDLTYELYDHNKSHCYGVELKVTKSLRASIFGAMKDIFRIRAIKESSWDFRSITSISIFYIEPKEYAKYAKLRDDLVSTGKADLIAISNHYSALFIGWEQPPKNATKENFVAWCDELDKIAKNHGVDIWGSHSH